VIVAGLVALVARRFLRDPKLVGLTVQLCGWLGRSVRRFVRALGRPPHASRPRADRTRRASAAPRLPSGRGWLVRALGYEAAGYGLQLAHLLAEPGMQATLAAFPGAGRALRPLCRMLWMKGVIELEAVVQPVVKAVRTLCLPVPALAAAGDAADLPRLGADCGVFAKDD